MSTALTDNELLEIEATIRDRDRENAEFRERFSKEFTLSDQPRGPKVPIPTSWLSALIREVRAGREREAKVMASIDRLLSVARPDLASPQHLRWQPWPSELNEDDEGE